MHEMNWERVSEIFESCLELPSHQWQDYVKNQCTADEINQGIAQQVLKLLKSSAKADAFFESLNQNIANDLGEEELLVFKPGDKFDKFRIVKELGHGGMARVFLCERDDGQFDQQVAVKIMKTCGNIDFLKDKFRQEQQILAGINHPNIAQLYDGGITPEGFPYIVMEYVEGLAIDKWCDDYKFNLNERIKLFLQVCNAMQYAHNRLIVHHDIKPANILVDKQANTKLLDFGISQVLHNNESAIVENSFTGTIGYAAPEQLKGAPPSVSSDIYKLGLVFFELITGNHFDLSVAQSIGLAKYIQQKLSNTFVLQNEKNRIKKSVITHDLFSVFLKVLAIDPLERFVSVSEFTHELENILNNQPLHFNRPNLSYKLKKSYLRNRPKVWILVFFNIALFISIGFFINQYIQTDRERERAEYILGFVFDVFQSVDPEVTQGDTITVIELLSKSIPRIDSLYHRPDFQMELYHTTGKLYTNLGYWPKAADLYLKAIDVLERLPAKRNTRIQKAEIYTDLAAAHRNMNEPIIADSLIAIALSVYQENPGLRQSQPLEFARTLLVQSHIMRMQANLQESIDFAIQGLAILNRHQKEPSWQKVTALANIAAAQKDLSLYQESEETTLNAMAIIDSLDSGITSTKVMLYGNYTILLGQIDRVEEAIDIQYQVLDMKKQLYGENSPTYLLSLLNLAGNYYRLENYSKSDSLNLYVIDAYTIMFGPTNNFTLSAIYNLANSWYSQGRFEEAIEYQKMVLEGDMKNFGEMHPFVAGSYYSLGLSHLSLNEMEKAKKNLYLSLDIYKHNFGDNHHQVGRVYGRLGDLYCQMDDMQTGEYYFLKGYHISLDIVGEDHPTTTTIVERMQLYGLEIPYHQASR